MAETPASSSAAAVPDQFKRQPRLPTSAVPRRYALLLAPDLAACTFTGSVSITLSVTDTTPFLVLNSLDLAVDAASVILRTPGREMRPSDVVLNADDELLVLGFADPIPVGDAVLDIGFSGVLNDHMRGFYRSKYEVDGVARNMAVTQFEAVEARRCFPCWDEPALKATFKITLEVPSELIALSNMPVANEIVHGHLKTVYFEESPIMSTYLVAVVVGLFDYIEDLTPDGTKVRVYCQIGKSDQGKFGLHVAVRSLELYKTYFSLPFSLPKLDLVVIPDFSGGAMENYGLITFRDTALLYDDNFSAAANKQWVATAVAHEVAHQWFGNLVTMEWWTHLWLNEGFATWVSYLAVDSFFPKWNIWTQYLELINGGIKLDALAESHPIEVDILRAREIDEIFDAISYKKGCSIIRMLQAYLGYDVFQKSVAAYIERYACRNAKTEDLWGVISEKSGVLVKMMMDSWTKQKGFPVVYVKSNGCMLEFEQSQFFSSGLHGDAQWIVPVTLCVGSYDNRQNFLLDSKYKTLDVSALLCQSAGLIQKSSDGKCDFQQSWVKINVEQTGFYRVKYDDTLAARIRVAIDGNCLSATDKFGVLDDSFALCEACEQPLSSLLLLMDVYIQELDYTVLSRLINVILKVSKVSSIGLPDLFHNLKQFFINILHVSYERLGWDLLPGDNHENGLLRGECLTALAILGDEIISKEAIGRFHAFLKDESTPLMPPDIRKAVYTAVMRSVTTTNRHGLECLLKVYRETDIGQEKGRILSAMTSSSDPDIMLESLNFLLSSEVRDQDVIYGLAGISWDGSETAWNWMRDKWELIEDRWGHHFLLTHFISNIFTQFATDEKADEMEEFFLSHPKPSITRTVKQSIEQVRVNARWASNMGKEHELEELITQLAEKNI